MTFQQAPPAQGTGCKIGLLGCGLGCPAVALGCFTAFAAFAFAIVWFVFALIKGSDAYTQSVAKAQSDARVVDALGAPVQTGWWVMGSLKTSGSSGRAKLTIPLSGPKASATLTVGATMSSSKWTFHRLDVEVNGGARIDLLGRPRKPSGGGAEAPPAVEAAPSPRGSPGDW